MFVATLLKIAETWKQPTSTDEGMDKENVIMCVCVCTYTSNGILFSHWKEGNSFIWDNMGRHWRHYAKWNKSDRKRRILYDLTYVWNLERKMNSKICEMVKVVKRYKLPVVK